MKTCINSIKKKFIFSDSNKLLDNGVLLMIAAIIIYEINFKIGTRLWLIGLMISLIGFSKHIYDVKDLASADTEDDI